MIEMPSKMHRDHMATAGSRTHPLSSGQCATMACLLEVSIPKPGNVHRGADFSDTTFYDFAISAVAIAPHLEAASQNKLGTTIINAAKATRQLVDANTNLGIILLLAPLATVEQCQGDSIARCIEMTDAKDCEQVYEAIRLCRPGGLGKVVEHDIDSDPPEHLLQAMSAAAPHDLIARQYTTGFHDVFEFVVPCLLAGQTSGLPLVDAVIDTHVRVMSRYPDSLIRRKSGQQTAEQAMARAERVLQAGAPRSENYLKALSDLDFWLRQDGNRRNPGTTADLITAGLFVALRNGLFPTPFLTSRPV